MAWFSVRSHYRFVGLDDGRDVFEERVVLFEARDDEDAVAMADQEAAEYAERVGPCEVLPLLQSYALVDEPQSGAEIYSLMRTSDLEPDSYVNHFFDTGEERTS